jgi:hypothetical protein
MSILNEEIKRYIDPATGLIAARDMGRDNLILNTATLISLLTATEMERGAWTLRAQKFLNDCTVSRGVFAREPGHPGPNSLDNLIAAVFVASPGQLLDIYFRGEGHHWFYNSRPREPYFGDWYGRFIAIPPFLRLAARANLKKGDELRLDWASWYTVTRPYKNTSDKCLLVLKFRKIAEQVGWKYPLIAQNLARLERMYPRGLSELYEIYYGLEHPFTRYAPKHWRLWE